MAILQRSGGPRGDPGVNSGQDPVVAAVGLAIEFTQVTSVIVFSLASHGAAAGLFRAARFFERRQIDPSE
jgi:hypothetical protein